MYCIELVKQFCTLTKTYNNNIFGVVVGMLARQVEFGFNSRSKSNNFVQ